jgi:DNA repair protein RadC
VAGLLAPFAGEEAAQLADRLIGRFGSLGRTFAARPAQLSAAMVGRTAVDAADPALHRYLRARLTASATERLHVIYCDSARRYLADETVASGDASRIEARARPVIERALALGAAGFMLAHNHPSGMCRPSVDDIDATRRLDAIAGALELELVDHLIVTRSSVFSMRAGGCL